ncbi:MAG TPA: phosphatase PAP2 family protein, partial [Pseudomonas sp.]|nr:phosphatase PAP2 family protein [Pseudomonas sp.]
MSQAPLNREAGLWQRGVLWLLLLAPLFFASYGLANWLTGQRGDVGTLVFAWESQTPLWPWTIVPYWSIDLLYGLSFLLPATRREMDRHALRLLSVQLLCIACFLLWPLRFTFARPELDGLFGQMFEVLMGFDKPFNQAPSLHIALLVIIWVMFARHTSGPWLRGLLHGWMALIGLSVLTTWQHHFIDVPTGALAGWLCVWLWPLAAPSPLQYGQLTRDPK